MSFTAILSQSHYFDMFFIFHQVELQKLQSQKEYFERSVSEMDADLRSCIEEADTTEKDEK